MTTSGEVILVAGRRVVEAYRLDRYDNLFPRPAVQHFLVVEAYRLDRYDNSALAPLSSRAKVVEAYRLDRYDNLNHLPHCRTPEWL